MDSFERHTVPQERADAQELFLLNSPSVQKAVMEMWAEESKENFADHNALAIAWISHGFAEKFGRYRDAHQDVTLDIHDDEAIRKLLLDLQERGEQR